MSLNTRPAKAIFTLCREYQFKKVSKNRESEQKWKHLESHLELLQNKSMLKLLKSIINDSDGEEANDRRIDAEQKRRIREIAHGYQLVENPKWNDGPPRATSMAHPTH
jgi:hypothetical protein